MHCTTPTKYEVHPRVILVLPEEVASSHPSTTNHDRPLREACSHMIHQKDIAMRKVFEDIILHAEITFTYLGEEADFDELQSHILDHAQFSRQCAMKVLQFLDVQGDQETPEEGDITLLQEFRMINAIAMAGWKLSPQVKAQEILRRSLRIESFSKKLMVNWFRRGWMGGKSHDLGAIGICRLPTQLGNSEWWPARLKCIVSPTRPIRNSLGWG